MSPRAWAARVSGDRLVRAGFDAMSRRLWNSNRPRLRHGAGDHETRDQGERGHEVDRGSETDEVRDGAGQEGADGVAEIAPEAIDAEAGRAPGGAGMVGDRGQERRRDHGRPEP